MAHNDDMFSFLRASLGWVLVALFLAGAMVVEWDNWGARRTIQRIQNWPGWQGMRDFGARILRRWAGNLDKKPPPNPEPRPHWDRPAPQPHWERPAPDQHWERPPPHDPGPEVRHSSDPPPIRRRGVGRRPVRTEKATPKVDQRQQDRRAQYDRWRRSAGD